MASQPKIQSASVKVMRSHDARARYRMLRLGERIRKGDEVRGTQLWMRVTISIGWLVGPEDVGLYRRPITRTRRTR